MRVYFWCWQGIRGGVGSTVKQAAQGEEYTAYYERARNLGRNLRVAFLIIFGLIAIGITYVKFRRLSPKMNPMEMAYPTVPHKGIPPKPPNIQQQRDDLPRPAIQKWQYVPRRAPRMHQKLPNGIEMLVQPLPSRSRMSSS